MTFRGLCGQCEHSRIVRNDRGSTFTLCSLSKLNPAYGRYPMLPVLTCDGFVSRTESEDPESGAGQ